MGQIRFNILMILNIYKDKLDALDLIYIGKEFFQGKKEYRYKIFEDF